MPPIAPSPQGSRATLITSLVIFVILFITSTILAIKYYSEWDASEHRLTEDKNAFNAFVTTGVMNNKEVAEIREQASKRAPLTAIELALLQRDELAKLITSNAAAPAEGVKADTLRSLAQVRADLTGANQSVTISDDNLLADLKALSGQIGTMNQTITQLQTNLTTANKATADAIASRDAALKAKDADIAAASQKVTETETASQTRETGIKATVDAIQKAADAAVAAAQGQTASTQAELGKVQAEKKKSDDLYKKLVSVLNRYRLNPSRSLLQPAGMITRVPGNNTVFINLGEGQQVSPGLTFEVYDKRKGLPSLTTLNAENPDELPAGKASIEVIRTIGSTSECRIIHVAIGQQIVEGDLILNLIYNTHTRFAFVVYGDFDMANTGQPVAGDAEVIRRLITQWGGRVMDQVNVDTDFIVLGKTPVVQPLPDNPTPLDTERHDKQQKAYDNYVERESEAIHLNIPILNQNRFLYFTGYYDQAKR